MTTSYVCITTYKMYKSQPYRYPVDRLALVEVRNGVECTDEFSSNADYYLEIESINPKKADKIYQAYRTLAKCGVLPAGQTSMRKFPEYVHTPMEQFHINGKPE